MFYLFVCFQLSHESEHITFVELHKAGKKTADIVRMTGFKQSTIYDAVKRATDYGPSLERSSNHFDYSGEGQPGAMPNSEVSMRKMAEELGMNRESVRNIVKRKLKLRSYKLTRIHFLNDAMKLKSLEKSLHMRRLVAGGHLQTVLFMNEKIFTVKPLHNCQNHRQLLKKGQQKTTAAKTIGRSYFPASVMVWAGICATRNVKINVSSYQQWIFHDTLDPWATQYFGADGKRR